MADRLEFSVAQCSEAGAKPENEDSIGVRIPDEETLKIKGAAIVMADGASGHAGGRIASECAVQGFLADYYSTPDSWSVKQSAHKVLTAINHWLHAESQRRYAGQRGMLTTFSGLVIKSNTAHLFHIGDTRIYRMRDGQLEQLTRDHRVEVGGGKTYLARALGADLNVEIDYQQRSVQAGDVFLLMCDGVYEMFSAAEISREIQAIQGNLEPLCTALMDTAKQRGSHDNLSCQAVRIESVPSLDPDEYYRSLARLPFPPALAPGMTLDGYKILKEMHASKRSQVYLAQDLSNSCRVALKTPSVNFIDEPAYIDGFLHEEWIGRRVDHPHIVKVIPAPTRPKFLYYATEFLEGQDLRQWMRDKGPASLQQMRGIIGQIAAALHAFHRLEIIHRDLKPENLIIDEFGHIKLIDFGCARIAAFAETARPCKADVPPGTREYVAPELMNGHPGDARSDQFSLAVLTYELLTGALPCKRSRYTGGKDRLEYQSALALRDDLPAWVDLTIKRALNPDPEKRYEALSEFIHDLSNPNSAYMNLRSLPIIQRDPVRFWKSVSLLLSILVVYLIYRLSSTL